MEIRKYASGDLDAVLTLFYETVHAVCLGDYTRAQVDAWADGRPDREAWARSLEAHFSLVACEGDALVGFGDIDASGYLDRLYVHKDFQRRGVAAALCERLEAHARGKAVTVHASITALPFFLRRGYRLVRAQTVFRKGVALNNFILEKTPPERTERRDMMRALLKADGGYVSVYGDKGGTAGAAVGSVVGCDERFVLLRGVDEEGRDDGYTLRALERVFAVERNDAYLRKLAILSERFEHSAPFAVDEGADMLDALLGFAVESGEYVSVELHASGFMDFRGRVAQVDAECFTLNAVDGEGRGDGVVCIDKSAVTRLDCASGAENARKYLHDRREAQKEETR